MKPTNAVRRETTTPADGDATSGALDQSERDKHFAAVRRVAAMDTKPSSTRSRDPGPTISSLSPLWIEAFAAALAIDARLIDAFTRAGLLYPPHPCPVWNRNESAAAHDARKHWEAQTAAIDRAFGVPPLDKAADRAYGVAQRIGDQILALHPRTGAEAAMKFGIVMLRVDDGKGRVDDPKPVHAFMADLEHLAERQRGGR